MKKMISRYYKIWVLICVCLVLGVACTKADDLGVEANTDTDSTTVVDTDLPNTSVTPLGDVDTDDPVIDGDSDDDENGEEVVPEKTQLEENKPFWQSESTRLTNNMISIALAAQSDYRQNGEKRGWMSKNGRLYGYYDGAYVTVDTLVADGYLESGLNASEFDILLLEGSDLQAYDGVTVPSESMGYSMFVVTRQADKILFVATSGKVGQISVADYNDLLSRYNQNNGTIVRLSSGAAEYNRILNYICLYEGQFMDYHVREIRKDDKYAVVVFSPATNTAKVKQYILRNTNNFWEVVLPNLQTEAYPIHAANRYLHDFNVDLLPGYNLASWRSYIVEEQGGALAGLFSGRYISSASEIYYQCGAGSCHYFVLNDGSRYVAYDKDGIWEVQPVSSDIAARSYFMSKTGADYSFIILDD